MGKEGPLHAHSHNNTFSGCPECAAESGEQWSTYWGQQLSLPLSNQRCLSLFGLKIPPQHLLLLCGDLGRHLAYSEQSSDNEAPVVHILQTLINIAEHMPQISPMAPLQLRTLNLLPLNWACWTCAIVWPQISLCDYQTLSLATCIRYLVLMYVICCGCMVSA